MRTRRGQRKSMREGSDKSLSPPAEPKKTKQEIMKEKNQKKGISQASQKIGKKKLKTQSNNKKNSNSKKSKQKQEKLSSDKDNSNSLQNHSKKHKEKDKQEQEDQMQLQKRLRIIEQKTWKTKIKIPKRQKPSEHEKAEDNLLDEESKAEAPSPKVQVQDVRRKRESRQAKPEKGTQELFSLVFSKEMMNAYLQKMGYNLKKLAVQSLSKDTIQGAFGILHALEFQLKVRNDKKKIEELTQEFFQDIPHDFGLSTSEKNMIDSEIAIKEKKQLLDSLLSYKRVVAMYPEALKSSPNFNELESKLERKISVVLPKTGQYEQIQRLLLSTHGYAHKSYKIELLELYKIQSKQQETRFERNLKNKQLLWYGTRLSNISALLCQGFTLPHYDLPSYTTPFGKGLYFTDCSSKAANNCYISKEEKIAILLASEVALGESAEMYYADPNASKLPPGKSSVRSVGKYSPVLGRAEQMGEVKLAMGPLEPAEKVGTTFLFNEYVVYRVEQVKMRYLLRVRFVDTPK